MLKRLWIAAGILLTTGSFGILADENLADSTAFSFDGYVISDSLEYGAETIDYYFRDKKIVLDTGATVNYLGRVLKSAAITYYQDYQYLEAQGTEDSTGTPVAEPSFSDTSGETLDGSEIKYRLDTQEGVVLQGRTTYEKGFMTAGTIKRVSADTLYISDGTYTTCDADHPHFYFHGKQMKFILRDKLIIKPIVGSVQDIPVIWFPFYVFPIAQGRQSGFLVPRYGESRQDGRYFSNIGYYFALSDYTDYRFSGTLRERNGWLINNWFNYNRRNSMSGSVFGSFEDEPLNGVKQWKLSGSHRHTVSPTFNMAGTVNLQSSEYSKNNSPNLYQVLNRNMRSSLTMTKRWRESGNSLIVTMDHQKNLDTNDRTITLPNLSFRKPNKLLFGGGQTTGVQRKYTRKSGDVASELDRSWYQNVYYTFNASFRNTETDKYSKSPAELALERLDPNRDSYDVHDERSVRNLGMDTRLTSSHKLLGWLTANPSVSLSENFEATTDSIGYTRTDNASAGIDLSTKVYGMFNPSIGSLRSIRHVISPSVTYSHGLRRRYAGTDADALYRFDKNDLDDSKNRQMNIALRNLFQAKMVDGDQEKKIDLFAVDFSTAVNFENETRRLSPLTTTIDVKPTRAVKILFRSTHEFYNSANVYQPFSPSLTGLSVTTTLGLSDQSMGMTRNSSRVNANKDLGRDMFDSDIDPGDEAVSSGPESSGTRMPFNVQIQHFYSNTRSGSAGKYTFTERQTIKPTIGFSPTRNFNIQYFLYYDIREKKLNDQRITLKRDLHCWEANLYWVITGIRQGYYIKINIKDLPDVKIEQRRGVSRYTG